MSGQAIVKISVPCMVPIICRQRAGNPGAEQQAVEVDALVAQRVALVDVDHRRREPLDVVDGSERRPRQRVALVEGFDAVAHRAAVVVQVEQDPVVLDRRRVLRQRPLARDVGAERVEALDEAEVAVLLELQAGGEGQVAAAALARRRRCGPGRCSVASCWRRPI